MDWALNNTGCVGNHPGGYKEAKREEGRTKGIGGKCSLNWKHGVNPGRRSDDLLGPNWRTGEDRLRLSWKMIYKRGRRSGEMEVRPGV